MLKSLFVKNAGLTPILKKICQLLHCTRTTHCCLSVLLYIQHLFPNHHRYFCSYLRCFFLVQIHWSYFHRCYFLFPCFFCLSQFCFIFSFRWLFIKLFLPTLTSLKILMLVTKRPYISCANDVEMWVLEEKKFIFVNRVIESYPRPIKAK